MAPRRGNRMAAAAAKKAAEMAATLCFHFGCTFKAAFAAAMKGGSYNSAAILLTEWADKVWNVPHYTYTANRSARADLLAGIGTILYVSPVNLHFNVVIKINHPFLFRILL